MPAMSVSTAARNEIFAGYTVLSSDSKIRSTGAVHVKTTASASFPALAQTAGFAGLTSGMAGLEGGPSQPDPT